jgi:hypothetical protein
MPHPDQVLNELLWKEQFRASSQICAFKKLLHCSVVWGEQNALLLVNDG